MITRIIYALLRLYQFVSKNNEIIMATNIDLSNSANNENLKRVSEKYGLPIFDEINIKSGDSAASVATAAMNNAASAAMMEEQNKFNAEEAEKVREFNADEAQKSREWNSEQEVMERRREAGLNASVTGQGSLTGGAGSGAQASAGAPAQGASVPSLQSPNIQNKTPEMLQSAIELAKAPVEIADTIGNIKKSQANIKALEAQERESDSQARYNAIMTELKPKEVDALVDNLASQTRLNEVRVNEGNAVIARTNQEIRQSVLKSVLDFQGADITREKLLQDWEVTRNRLEFDVRRCMAELKHKGLEISFNYASEFSDLSNWNITPSVNFDFGMFKDAEKSTTKTESTLKSRKVKNPPLINIGKAMQGFNRASSMVQTIARDFLGTNFNVGADFKFQYSDTESSRRFEQNAEAWNKAIEAISACEIWKSAKTDEEKIKAMRIVKSRRDYLREVMELNDIIDTQLLSRKNIIPTQ